MHSLNQLKQKLRHKFKLNDLKPLEEDKANRLLKKMLSNQQLLIKSTNQHKNLNLSVEVKNPRLKTTRIMMLLRAPNPNHLVEDHHLFNNNSLQLQLITNPQLNVPLAVVLDLIKYLSNQLSNKMKSKHELQ